MVGLFPPFCSLKVMVPAPRFVLSLIHIKNMNSCIRRFCRCLVNRENKDPPHLSHANRPTLSAPHRPQFPNPRRNSVFIRERQRLPTSALLSTTSINLTHHPAPHRQTNSRLQQRSSPTTKRARARGALCPNDTYGRRQGMDVTLGRSFFSFSLF